MKQQFYTGVRDKYGNDTAQLLKEYADTVKLTANTSSSQQFLLECRKYSLIPKFIQNSTTQVLKLINKQSRYTTELNKIVSGFHSKVLNVIIKDKCMQDMIVQNRLHSIEELVLYNEVLPWDLADDFLRKQKKFFISSKAQAYTKHCKKFNRLYSNLIREFDLKTDDKSFVNLSDVEVPKDVEWLLSLGKKFALPHGKGDFPLFELIVDTEELVRSISDHKVKDIARARIANIIANTTQTCTKSHQNILDRLIAQIHRNTVKFIKRNTHIIVVQADKGNATVIMNTEEYHNKIAELLSDTNTYRRIGRDPTNKLQTQNNKLITELEKLKVIDKASKYRLMTYNTSAPKLYALPKIHKNDVPLRPVVASIDTPSSRVSKMVADILKNTVEDDKYNMKNSFAFKDMVSKKRINITEKMVSFDIVSLFTNIPVDLALSILNENWDRIAEKTDIPKDLFFKLLNFCLYEANYFQYNGRYYKQIFGMPMGNTLSTIIADIVTQRLLDTALGKLEYTPTILTKYVDDIFAIIPSTAVRTTLGVLNAFHPRIQFTVEEEKNGQLAYLDVLVIRTDEQVLETNWHRKCIRSDRMLNFYTHHPMTQKLNTARNFVNRVLTLSSEKFHEDNVKQVRTILSLNNYPAHIINQIVRSELEKVTATADDNRQILQTSNAEKREKRTVYKRMPYVKCVSDRITKVIRSYLPEITTAFRSLKRVGGVFTKLKDKIPNTKRTNVIYKIPCKGNMNTGEMCKFSYVGQTKQYLGKRIQNHMCDLRKVNDNALHKTALMDHFLTLNHYPDFAATSVLGTQQHYSRRLTLESLHIYTEDTINIREDTDNISSVYCSLLDNKRRRPCPQTQGNSETYGHYPPRKKRRLV